MTLSVYLFASLKERVGRSPIEATLPNPATVAHLRQQLAQQYPLLAPYWGSSLVAINRAYADETTPIQLNDEIAFFPPVSGG